MVPLWVPIIIRHLYLGYPKKRTIILTTTHISAKCTLEVCVYRRQKEDLSMYLCTQTWMNVESTGGTGAHAL